MIMKTFQSQMKVTILSITIFLFSCSSGDIKEGNKQDLAVSGDADFIQNFRVMILPPTKSPGKGKKGIVISEPKYDGFVAELTSALVNSGKAVVVDREKTAAALNEISFGKTGLVDSSTALNLGKITGAQKFVSPGVSGNVFTLSMTDIETTKVEYSKSVSLDQYSSLLSDFPKFLDHKLLLTNMSKLKSKDSSLKVSLKSSKKKYLKNEPISFEVSVSDDAYLYLILIQNDGEIFTIFPNDDQPDNFLKSGKAVTIPNSKSGFVFTAGEPFGTDVIKAIASKEKMNLFQPKKVEGTPFGQVTGSKDTVTRGIKRVTTGLKSSDWNSSEISIETAE